MTKILLSIATLFLLAAAGTAQNTFPSTGAAGVGTATPDASSLLEIKSIFKGLLIPRMTQKQRDLISSPATGLLIYQTNNNPSIYFYNGSKWQSLTDAAKDLSNLNSTAVNSSLIPAYSGSIDVGASSKTWRNGYFSALTISGTGVSSTVSAGNAVYGNNTSSEDGAGVYGNSSNGNGVYGNSGNWNGVYGSGSTGVYGTGYSYGIYGISSTGYGVYSSGTTGVFASGINYGVYSLSSGTNSYGVYGSGSTGIYGTGSDYGVYGNSYSAGVYGTTNGGWGGFFVSNTGVGVQAGTNNPSQYAGAFYGKVYTSQGYVTSDKNLKKNIQDFNSALSIINKLKPKFYEFKDDAKYTFLHLPNGKHYGLLAQDIEQVLPDLVNESWHKNMVVANSSSDGKPLSMSAMAAQQAMVKDSVKIKAVNYIELIPIMIKALQELNAKNDDLQNQINELKSTSAKESAVGNITSSASYLKQNVPNPAHDKTAIHYYVAGNNTKAEIRITDKEGKILKIFPVSAGESQLILDNTGLAAGVYHYSLYVNAQLVDAKQMILIK